MTTDKEQLYAEMRAAWKATVDGAWQNHHEKHLSRMLDERGFYAVLRQLAKGNHEIGRDAQLRILKFVEETVQKQPSND
jgi:hypothetical protein